MGVISRSTSNPTCWCVHGSSLQSRAAGNAGAYRQPPPPHAGTASGGTPGDLQVSNHVPSGPEGCVPSLNSHKTVLPQSLGEPQGTCASCSHGWLQPQQHLMGGISPPLSQSPFQTLSQHLLPVPPQFLAPMFSSLLVLIQSGVKAHVTALLAASPPTCWP